MASSSSSSSRVTFAGPFHPLDDVRVSSFTYPPSASLLKQQQQQKQNDNTTPNSSSASSSVNTRRCWRFCLLPVEDKCLLLQMHNDPRCSVPITVYMFAVINLQRIFRGVLVRRRVVLVLAHPESRAVLHQTYRNLNQIDWNEIRFRHWRMAESVVAERYEELFPRLTVMKQQPNNSNGSIAGGTLLAAAAARFAKLRLTVCAKWRATLLNMEFSRWAQYDRWQIYFVAAVTIQRAWREFRQFLVEAVGGGADRRKLLRDARRGKSTRSNYNNNNNRNDNKNLLLATRNNNNNNSKSKNNQSMMLIETTKNRTLQTRGAYRYDHYLPHSSVSRENFAAAVIQELFRRFVYRRVFLLFVRLIKSREGAATQHVLRAVSPSEAFLADKASGLHARFRLSSPINPKDKFPPSLVFKVFTHSNVADIGSFAPRNYVADRQLNFDGAVTNTVSRSPLHLLVVSSSSSSTKNATLADVRAQNTKTKNGWYDREENNEWRLVADVALLSRRDCGPEVLEATTHAAVRHFFFSYLSVPQKNRCLQDLIVDEFIRRTQKRAEKTLRGVTRDLRGQQREQQLKQKQRKWMISLYAGSETAIAQAASSVQQTVAGVQQLLRDKASMNNNNNNSSSSKFVEQSTELRDEDVARLTRVEARRTVDGAFDCLSEEEQAKEMERLLQWTQHLDAAKYSQDWLKLGTTGK